MSDQPVVSVSHKGGEETETHIDPADYDPVEQTPGSTGRLSALTKKYVVSGTGELPPVPHDSKALRGLIAPRTVIGEDDRIQVKNTQDFPWRMICSLKIFGVGGQVWFGTGWIAGPRTVITAGHCVYHAQNLRGWAERIVVIPGQDEEEQPFGNFESESFSTIKEWKDTADTSMDIGAVHLSKPLPEEVGQFSFANLPAEELNEQLVNTSGYPGNKGGGNQLWHGRDRVCVVQPDEFFYETDTEKGQSGAPVYLLKENKRPVVVGIHAYGVRKQFGGNSATRINQRIFGLLHHWIGEEPKKKQAAASKKQVTPVPAPAEAPGEVPAPAEGVPAGVEDTGRLPSKPRPQLVYIPGDVAAPAPGMIKRRWDEAIFGTSIGAESVLFSYTNLLPELELPLEVGSPFLQSVADEAKKRYGKEAYHFIVQLAKDITKTGDNPLLYGVSPALEWLSLATVFFFGKNQGREKIAEQFFNEIATTEEGARPSVLVTHGFGGVVAYDLLTSHEDRIRKVFGQIPYLITLASPLAYSAIREQMGDFQTKRGVKYPEVLGGWYELAVNDDPVAAEVKCCRSKKYFREEADDVSRELLQGSIAEAYLAHDKLQDKIKKIMPKGYGAPISSFLFAQDVAEKMADREVLIPVLIELNIEGEGTDTAVERADTMIKLIFKACEDSDPTKDNAALPDPRSKLPGLRLNIMHRYVGVSLKARQLRRLERQLDLIKEGGSSLVHNIWQNARVQALIDKSKQVIQAQAALRTYQADGENVHWAVLDTGIDQCHEHFKIDPDGTENPEAGDSLIEEVLDFTAPNVVYDGSNFGVLPPKIVEGHRDPCGHGTHVSAIIAGGTKRGTGIAPKAKLHVYKVLEDSGRGTEAAVIRAIEHVYNVNAASQSLRIHGVNVSLGSAFDPTVYACGHSPICRELRRLWHQGVVVCVAAGNAGLLDLGEVVNQGSSINLDMSIGDPANLQEAIAVGSIHKQNPHSYGISYFSSRGPTADGRKKPDCVAPGEKILSADSETADGYREDSGTSMACPHVSGLIAAFLSRRPEFKGQPERVKEILLENCIDIGRDRYHQGAGVPNLMQMLANT